MNQPTSLGRPPMGMPPTFLQNLLLLGIFSRAGPEPLRRGHRRLDLNLGAATLIPPGLFGAADEVRQEERPASAADAFFAS